MSKDIRTISAQELKNKMSKDHKITVINALDKDTYNDCHIPGTINIPLQDLKNTVSDWDRNKEIVTYCASDECPVSKEAYEALVSMGFNNVTAYEGGMREWKKMGLPSQGACKAEYLEE